MIEFQKRTFVARFGDPRRHFEMVDLPTEVRVCPLTGKVSRFTAERFKSASLGETAWPDVSTPVALSRADCPFCPEVLAAKACMLEESRFGRGRFTRGEAFLFPNLAPYGPYSAVTVIGREHYTEVGAYDPAIYRDAYLVSLDYLSRVLELDPAMAFAVITQNHLPASGGTLVHPHLQVQAEADGPSFAAFWRDRLQKAARAHGRPFVPLLIETEKARGERYIGATGAWEWLTMWAPQGYCEVWGFAPAASTVAELSDRLVTGMVDGLLRVQHWYRDRGRNSFNMGVYLSAPADPAVPLACRIMARANWSSFGRSDRSFFEVLLGEMVFDQAPERWAAELKPYFAAK